LGVIYLVRHAQAAFGTSNYDQLTETGLTQARLLGAYFGQRKVRFDALYTGTLQRHVETAQGVLDGYSERGHALRAERACGLDEYNGEALIMEHTGRALVPHPAASRRDSTSVREHVSLLRKALLSWAEGAMQPGGMPTWQAFQEAAVAALLDVRLRHPEGNVLVVSSGGPIGAIVAAALEAPPRIAVELNLWLRNSSLTEFVTSARRQHLVSFNALPHLDRHPDASLSTYI
jgi:broad specificity phosphatase PhoE